MTKKISIAFMAMILMLMPSAASAEKLIIGAIDNFPPYMYTENGSLIGTHVDIIREICKRAGIEPEFQPFPFKRYVHEAKTGDLECLTSLGYAEDRAEFLYYCSEPTDITRGMLFAHKGSGIKINSLDDLKDKTVAVVIGMTYTLEFDKMELKKEICDDQRELVRMFAKGRADLAVAYEPVFKSISKQMGLQDKFEPVYTITERNVYTAFSKNMGDRGKALSEKFSEVLKQMKADGTYQKITDQYLK